MKPFVVLPFTRSRPLIEERFKKVHIHWAGSGVSWMRDDSTSGYLQKIIGGTHFGEKRLLIWDAYRCHTSVSTKKTLKSLSLQTAVIPGGTTKFVQPPDTHWNAPFKAKIGELYNE